MIDYSALWKKGNDIFYEWELSTGKALSDDDRKLFVTGWIQGYLYCNDVEVNNG